MSAKLEDGKITVDLGGQVAVKKVTFRITKTTNGGTLADISRVEFLNDMANRIPEPEMDIPQEVQAVGADKSFTVTWKPCVNVTGYEVEISYGGDTELHRVAGTTLEIKQFKGGKLKNGDTYGVRVQSVNGTWLSGYSTGVEVTPETNKKPDPPENIKAAGGYRRIRISWKI